MTTGALGLKALVEDLPAFGPADRSSLRAFATAVTSNSVGDGYLLQRTLAALRHQTPLLVKLVESESQRLPPANAARKIAEMTVEETNRRLSAVAPLTDWPAAQRLAQSVAALLRAQDGIRRRIS